MGDVTREEIDQQLGYLYEAVKPWDDATITYVMHVEFLKRQLTAADEKITQYHQLLCSTCKQLSVVEAKMGVFERFYHDVKHVLEAMERR